MEVRHLISIEDVTADWFMELYSLCREIISSPGDFSEVCKGKLMASLFFEPSTRTNFSFQAAMKRLGGQAIGFSNPNSTSNAKGESLADTVRICATYTDTIVMRSPLEGSAFAASLYSDVPVINAGDGGHMHPTQTLTDLATICEKRGAIRDLNVGLCGDLKNGRTVHSLAMALSKFPNIRFTLISPRDLAMPDYMLSYLKSNGQKYLESTNLDAAIPSLDVLYMTRIQKERFADPREYERHKNVYILTGRKLERAKKDMLVMHPLPRLEEISVDVDSDPRAVYFEQARYGMFIRMALLLKTTYMKRERPELPKARKDVRCGNPACVLNYEPDIPVITKESGGEEGLCCAYCDKKVLTKF